MSKKLSIDGPAGRQEVNKNYRDNYDNISWSKKSITTDGGKEDDRKNS